MSGYETYVTAFGFLIAGMAAREVPRIVLEHVLLRKSKSKGEIPNGNGLASATRRDVREVFVDTLKADVLPVLSKQTDILCAIAQTNKEMSEGIAKLVTLEETRRRK